MATHGDIKSEVNRGLNCAKGYFLSKIMYGKDRITTPLLRMKDGAHFGLRDGKCLSCHSRRRTEESQAPMVSVTHYMDRDGNFLAEVSPRRYFCEQCHMTQIDTKPLVESTFEDVDTIIERKRSN